jgi:hypothetical protein
MRLGRTIGALLLVLGSGSGPVLGAERPLYGDPTPFGPANVSFPWFAAFSPDGRWVGFTDGHSPYVEVWDVAKGTRAWPTDGKARRGTHRVSFSADSSRMAFVDGERLVVLSVEAGAWKEVDATTLDAKPPTSARVSPLRLDFAPSGLGAVFATGDGAVRIDLTCGCMEEVGEGWKDVVATFAFPDASIAVAREKEFATHVLPPGGKPVVVPGVLLETDAKAATWLVASDPKRFDLGFLDEKADARLALEIRDAQSSKARASFELHSRREAGSPNGHRLLLQAQFSPDGTLLATVEGTGAIVLRDAATGAPVQRIEEYAAPPYPMGVAFSPDGKTLLTGGRRPPGRGERDVLLWKRRGTEPAAGGKAR